MIAACTTLLNEADILAKNLAHLYDEGVDEIFAAVGPCNDETPTICLEYEVHTLIDNEPIHYQPRLMNRLADWAHDNGHDWIIAFDADEFWYATEAPTIRDAIRKVPDSVGVLCARMFQHHDWDHRELGPKPFPSVAYRWAPTARIANGNHSVSGVPGDTLWGVLDLRELQYRGFDHFCRKVRERCDTLDRSLPSGDGAHHTRFRNASLEELRAAWDAMREVPTVYDPIPL